MTMHARNAQRHARHKGRERRSARHSRRERHAYHVALQQAAMILQR